MADCDGARRRLAEAADRRVAHRLAELVEERVFLGREPLAAVVRARRASASSCRYGADAARHALAARLVAEERGDAADGVAQVGRGRRRP